MRYNRFNPTGELIINDIPIPPGESDFTLNGTNIQMTDLSLQASDGSEIPFWSEEGENVVHLYVSCPNQVIHCDS